MDEKTKYVIVLLLAIIVSSATSYLTTLSLRSSSTESPQPSSNSTQQPTSIKIFPSYTYGFGVPPNEGGSGSSVTVYSDVVIYNLTIDYLYTTLNGTTLTSNITYGTFHPSYSSGEFVTPGELPSTCYLIPQDIISACSTTYYDPANTEYFFKIPPQLNVTEVYGYS